MVDVRKIIRANMRALTDWFGCYDAVAETINARWGMVSGGGGASKGTISKKVSAVLDWTVNDVIAIEDAVGRYPVTRLLARRLEHRAPVNSCSLLANSASIAKESGEAIAAILSAEQSSEADDYAQAIKEIDDAISDMRRARAQLEVRLEGGAE